MNVLFVLSNRPHAHDYMAGALLQGFRGLIEEHLNIGRVIDWPAPDWVHLEEDPLRPGSWSPRPGTRDECNLDSDCAVPRHDWSDERIFQALRDGEFSAVVGGTWSKDEMHSVLTHNRKGTPVAFVHAWDANVQVAVPGGAKRFKREMPLGPLPARPDWSGADEIPCPLSYPERRVPVLDWRRKEAKCVYYSTTHMDTATARMLIAEDLRAVPNCDVRLGPDQRNRPPPEEVHRKLARALVGVHWNPTKPLCGLNPATDSGWDGWRFWENCAWGCVSVSLKPFIEMPFPFEDGKSVVWVTDPDQIRPAVERLLADPGRAYEMAQAAHRHFLRYHCSAARAAWVLKHLGFSRFEGGG